MELYKSSKTQFIQYINEVSDFKEDNEEAYSLSFTSSFRTLQYSFEPQSENQEFFVRNLCGFVSGFNLITFQLSKESTIEIEFDVNHVFTIDRKIFLPKSEFVAVKNNLLSVYNSNLTITVFFTSEEIENIVLRGRMHIDRNYTFKTTNFSITNFIN